MVPMKFKFNGEPNDRRDWQGKEMLWFLPGMSIFLYLFLTGLTLLTVLFPQGYHGLARPLTPELLGQLNRTIVLMVELIKLGMIGLFFNLTQQILEIGRGKVERFNNAFVLIFLGGIFAVVVLSMLYLKVVLHV